MLKNKSVATRSPESVPTLAWRTDIGRLSENNEDNSFAEAELGLWLVADGMGGHAAGEVASEIVVETVSQKVAAGDDLETAIRAAHKTIKRSARDGRGASGMGSTVVALRLQGAEFDVAWVGDSRAYLWNGKLTQLSHDHSFVQRLVDLGALTASEARVHPNKNVITQSLGAVDLDDVEVGRHQGVLLKGQKILLCSDGLSDELTDETIAAILNTPTTDQEMVEQLVNAALDQGGRDNITVQLISAPQDAPTSYEEYLARQPQADRHRMTRTMWIAVGGLLVVGLITLALLSAK